MLYIVLSCFNFFPTATWWFLFIVWFPFAFDHVNVSELHAHLTCLPSTPPTLCDDESVVENNKLFFHKDELCFSFRFSDRFDYIFLIIGFSAFVVVLVLNPTVIKPETRKRSTESHVSVAVSSNDKQKDRKGREDQNPTRPHSYITFSSLLHSAIRLLNTALVWKQQQ